MKKFIKMEPWFLILLLVIGLWLVFKSKKDSLRAIGIFTPLLFWILLTDASPLFRIEGISQGDRNFFLVLSIVPFLLLYLFKLFINKDIHGSVVKKIGIIISAITFTIIVIMLSVYEFNSFSSYYRGGQFFTLVYIVNAFGMLFYYHDYIINIFINWLKKSD